jgi:hypothetical protein
LKPGGTLLLCNANRELPDFNPSPHSHRYFSLGDFAVLFRPYNVRMACFGDCEVDYGNPKQRVLSLIKKTMVRFDLMPKTMAGKKFFKRLVFGDLIPMPAELTTDSGVYNPPCEVDPSVTDRKHKVIFVVVENLEK